MKLIIDKKLREVNIPDGYYIVLNGVIEEGDLCYLPWFLNKGNDAFHKTGQIGEMVSEFYMVIRKYEE